ncbi:helix-turn-helix domain-containing protein [Sphaerotilus sp.]|uniref:helix-turn-helix domain-containing protein n=1 Tax=Sphaerotilus sp. TaxID=2093942 RepID=UPI0025DBA507|nr:helix-turn-helix transcriptional regulator [Sphaerotilus sp.]
MLDFCPTLDPDYTAHHPEVQDAAPVDAEPRWLDPAVREILAGEDVRNQVEFQKLVGQRIIRARKACRLEGKVLALKIGHKNGTQLSLWESGERTPPLAGLLLLSAHLGVSVEYLCGCSPEEDPDRMEATRREAIRQARSAIEAAVGAVATACTSLPRAAAEAEAGWNRLGGLVGELLGAIANCRERNERLFDDELIGGARLIATADRLALSVADMGARCGLHDRLRADIAEAHGRVIHQRQPDTLHA